MKNEKWKPIIKGLIKHLPLIKNTPKATGGTNESRYCYAVYLRHLNYWNTVNKNVPEVVAELGPGDSIGIGLAALLTGSKQLYALDVAKYWDDSTNLRIFEELVTLFRDQQSIPDPHVYPKVRPYLEDYNFPHHILSDTLLKDSLAEERLNVIRKEIMDINNPQNIFIKTHIPWYDTTVINSQSVDFIFSQAVLQHVENLDNTYMAMSKWIKPSGFMSHTIDLQSMGITPTWNGHYTFSDFEWKIVKGRRSFLINREAISKHLELHSNYGFSILNKTLYKKENKLINNQLANRFKELSPEDLTTSGAYLLSKKNA